jgi:hypothetical protein
MRAPTAINVAGPLCSKIGNQYPFIAMDNQQASTTADMLLINFYFHLRVSRELHSDQGQNFESQLLQEFSWSLKICKMHNNLLHAHSDGMVD